MGKAYPEGIVKNVIKLFETCPRKRRNLGNRWYDNNIIILQLLDTYIKKKPQGNGAVAEHDYWKDRELALSMVVEQLFTPIVKKILFILNESLSPIASAFDYFQIELLKYYSQAKDNKKFLSTVLRYFKVTNLERN